VLPPPSFIMPVSASRITVQTYRSALSLPASVWDFFATHQEHTNVMYPVAKKLKQQELTGITPSPDTFWMTCSTTHSSHSDRTLDFVLSCTPGPEGRYPIFICTTVPVHDLRDDFIRPRMEELVRFLYASVPLERVYSVFAPVQITNIFAFVWTKYTGIQLDQDPEYYSAKLTFCTLSSSRNRRASVSKSSFVLRSAVEADIPAAAVLCHGFAAVSEPFILSVEGAIREATNLIRNNQLWVHEIVRPNQPKQMASIVAVSRQSESVAGITKVFTDPSCRSMGCAERLVRVACGHLLKTHTSVILYVAHNNPAAAKVYHRVGFHGLDPSSKTTIDGVEDWLELGFDRNQVELGHW